MSQESELEKALREFFCYAFITNCRLDTTQISEKDLNAVNTIQGLDLLEAFKELVLALLKYKRDCKLGKKGKENTNEKEVKQLESEIRNHIRIEQQLKLTTEFFKLKYEESEKNYKKVAKKIKEFEGTMHTEPSSSLECALRRKYLSMGNVGGSMEFKNFEQEEFMSSKQKFQVLKQKLEEKSKEIVQIQEKLREKISRRNNSTSAQPTRISTLASEEIDKRKQVRVVEGPLSVGKSNTARCISAGIKKKVAKK